MFDFEKIVLIENKIVKYQILKNKQLLSFKEVIQYWETDDVFNDFLTKF
jgi:hypothetical protein